MVNKGNRETREREEKGMWEKSACGVLVTADIVLSMWLLQACAWWRRLELPSGNEISRGATRTIYYTLTTLSKKH